MEDGVLTIVITVKTCLCLAAHLLCNTVNLSYSKDICCMLMHPYIFHVAGPYVMCVSLLKRLRLKPSTALKGKPITELQSVTCHMGSHSVTCHPTKWTRPAITPASQAGTRFIYPGRMEGWVDLGSLIEARPGIEPTTAWLQVRCPNCYATESLFRE